MNAQALEIYARICACNARIEAMKAKNALNLHHGMPPVFGEDAFNEEASHLEDFSNQIHEAWQRGLM